MVYHNEYDNSEIRLLYISEQCPVFETLENISKFFALLPSDARIARIRATNALDGPNILGPLCVCVWSRQWKPGDPKTIDLSVRVKQTVELKLR